MQAIVLLREIRRHQSRGEQCTVESIAPGMISASQTGDAPLGYGADEGAAVPADIVERIDGRLVAAHDDDGFIDDLVEKIVALVAHAVDVAGDDPLTADDPVHVRLEHGIVAVEPAVQAIADLGVRGQPRDCGGFGFTHDVTSDFNSSRRTTRVRVQRLMRSFFGSYRGRKEAVAG